VTLALSLLGGVELDFQCGGFCKKSKFYTFSEIANGPPPQDCVNSIESATSKAQVYTVVVGLILIITSLLGIVESFILGCRKKDDDDYYKQH
jgi:hypothetical protein